MEIRHMVWTIIPAALMLTGFGCNQHSDQSSSSVPHVFIPETTGYTGQQATAERISAFNLLKHGDSPEHVLSVLGAPNRYISGAGKEPNAPVLLVVWYYYFSKPPSLPLNEKIDKWIALYFDASNRLVAVSPANLAEVEGWESRTAKN